MIKGQCVYACQIQAFLEMISARRLCLLILKRDYTRLIASATTLEPDFICVKRSEGKSMHVQRTEANSMYSSSTWAKGQWQTLNCKCHVKEAMQTYVLYLTTHEHQIEITLAHNRHGLTDIHQMNKLFCRLSKAVSRSETLFLITSSIRGMR